MTGSSSMLQNLCGYPCIDAVIIGEVSTHVITHVGDTYINNGTTSIGKKFIIYRVTYY